MMRGVCSRDTGASCTLPLRHRRNVTAVVVDRIGLTVYGGPIRRAEGAHCSFRVRRVCLYTFQAKWSRFEPVIAVSGEEEGVKSCPWSAGNGIGIVNPKTGSGLKS
jgi:hypothetical protein